MNKLLLLFFFAGLSGMYAQQSFNTTNIEVTLNELNAAVYTQDSTANAFYIFEKGYSRFQQDGNYNLLTDYEAKIKILNQKGYDNANVEIRLFKNKSSREKLTKLEATTYFMKNGMRQSEKLDPKMVYTEENETYDLVKFTFPAITPGAVIVYSYQKESPFRFNFEPWWFQTKIPKVYSSYDTNIPGNFRYNIKKVGELELDVHTSEIKKGCFQPSESTSTADCVISKYTMNNIPAFIEEPYLTSRYNFISRIEYELTEVINLDGNIKKYTQSWKDVDRELKNDKNIGKQLKRTSLVKDLLPKDIQEKSNDLEKARAIYDFVKQNYKWNGEYRIFSDMNLKDVLQEKTGNVAGINILLHNIYEEQGFQVLPIMSSTRANGELTQVYPVLSEFNYIMLQLMVDGTSYLVDATEKNLDFGDIPFRSLNQYARLLDFDNESTWIDIVPEKFSAITMVDSLKINIDGTSTGKSQQIFTGYHALIARNKIEKISTDAIFNSVSTPNSFTKGLQVGLKNKDTISEALQVNYLLVNDTQKINDAIYFNPFSFKFFDRNPFQLKERHYPIDFGFKDAYTYVINLEIPENYQVVELPEQKLVSLPESGGSLKFFAQQTDEKHIAVHCRILFPKVTYISAYYPYLKDFFESILEVQTNSLIVLKENI